MSFFIRKVVNAKPNEGLNGKYVKKGLKRKKSESTQHLRKRKAIENGDLNKHSLSLNNEEIESDLESEIAENSTSGQNVHLELEDDGEETAQDKKVRLAKLYLAEVEREECERAEREVIDKDVIAHRLKEDYLEQSGKLKKTVADNYVGLTVMAFSFCGVRSINLPSRALSYHQTISLFIQHLRIVEL